MARSQTQIRWKAVVSHFHWSCTMHLRMHPNKPKDLTIFGLFTELLPSEDAVKNLYREKSLGRANSL